MSATISDIQPPSDIDLADVLQCLYPDFIAGCAPSLLKL